MNIAAHVQDEHKIAEVIADDILISNGEEGLQLFMDLYYQGFEGIILHEKNISPGFFDLKTGLAGEILQKCSNYNIRLAIAGDFSKYPGQSIRAFIVESNKGRQVNFLPGVPEAKDRLFAG